MFTGPAVRVCFAMTGYGGCGRLMTFEFSTTDVTLCVVGGLTGGGSGGLLSVSTRTTVAVPLQFVQPESREGSNGGSAFRPVIRTGPVTVGIGDALTPTSCGIRRGSFVGGIAAVRSETVMFLSTGAVDGVDLRTAGRETSLIGLGAAVTGGTQFNNSRLLVWASSCAS